MLVDGVLVAWLEQRGVTHALMGGVALASWGVVRYTQDVDLLTLDDRVLRPGFWAESRLPSPRIRVGDSEDPLAGVVRFDLSPPHDLVVGKGAAARIALERRQTHPDLPCPVADATGLVLLKLEAGAPQDLYDVLGLLDASLALGKVGLREEVESLLPQLTQDARKAWGRLQSLR